MLSAANLWIRHIKQMGFILRCSVLPLQGILNVLWLSTCRKLASCVPLSRVASYAQHSTLQLSRPRGCHHQCTARQVQGNAQQSG